MFKIKPMTTFLLTGLIIAVILSGYGFLSYPYPKMETDEQGAPKNRAHSEMFLSAPNEIYDIDNSAGQLYETISRREWADSRQYFGELKEIWKNVNERFSEGGTTRDRGDARLNKLSESITAGDAYSSHENLNSFMRIVSKTSENYKLSPVSDIISVGVVLRDAGFYTQEENWDKAAAVSEELDHVWNQSKPTLEHMGVLREVTKLHSIMNKIKDEMETENKDAALDHISDAKKV
jgi:hypothetical protein